jgi:hypothetical protein
VTSLVFDAAADGLHVCLAMVVVAGIFLGVIAIGELVRSANHRRHARRPRPY